MEKVCCVWYSIGLIGLVGWVWLRLSREQRQPARHPVYRAAIRSKGGCGCRHLPRSLTSAIELGRGLSGELKRSSSSRRLLDVGGVESCVGKEKEAERKRGQWRHCSSSTCAPISVPGNNGCRAIYYSSGRSNGSFAHRRANAPRVTLCGCCVRLFLRVSKPRRLRQYDGTRMLRILLRPTWFSTATECGGLAALAGSLLPRVPGCARLRGSQKRKFLAGPIPGNLGAPSGMSLS